MNYIVNVKLIQLKPLKVHVVGFLCEFIVFLLTWLVRRNYRELLVAKSSVGVYINVYLNI